MRNILRLSQRILSDESGQDLIEYALIAALISLAAIATLKTLATAIESVFTAIQTQLSTAIQ
jgi:pilus assembly protein Flp/PilA